MTMWDDLMNTFSFPPDATHHTSYDLASPVHSLSPSSNPCSPHVGVAGGVNNNNTVYTFPTIASTVESSGAKRAAMMTRPINGHPTRQLARSSSNKDLQEEMESVLPGPYMRPRVYTWGSAMSDSVHAPSLSGSGIHPAAVEAAGSSGGMRRNIGPNKRRATCPDSMRNYRGRATASRTVSSGLPVAKQCPKIDDVESDITDDEAFAAGSNDIHSSGDASTASDLSFETHLGTTELTIVRQPESHHRARYQKEGSRGCIKDRTGNSCPAVQLRNYSGPTIVLQAFIGTESGPIRPHPLYRVCKVGGKHSTPCRERILDSGITALEMDLTRENNYILNVDCLGIMKLRNADFEQVFDAEDLAKRRKRSPKVRLVFRALLPLSDGRSATLQVISTPICCTPSPGVPEIHFISHASCPASGGTDIVVIGRNFVKDDSKLYIVEKNQDDTVIWEREVTLLQENFNQVHLVGSLPAYRDQLIKQAVDVNLYVRNKGGKQSEPHKFTYLPDQVLLQRIAAATAPPATPPASLSHQHSVEQSILGEQSPIVGISSLDGATGLPVIRIPQHYGQTAVNGQNLQYCIQLPGSLQPIIITIPQSGGGGVTSEPMAASPQQHQVYAGDLRQQQQQQQQQLDGGSFSTPVATSSMMMDPALVGAGQVGTSDEDLFNELLREILGTQEQSLDFDQTESTGSGFMNVDQSPVASPDPAVAALSAARSFRALDINRSTQSHGPNFLLDEEHDDFMG